MKPDSETDSSALSLLPLRALVKRLLFVPFP